MHQDMIFSTTQADLVGLLPMIGTLIVAGAAIGLLAGLFGIGGGAISVPVFFELFGVLGYPDEVRMPMAVGTSLAVIIPTSLNSARGHFKRGTVDMALLRLWAVPVICAVPTRMTARIAIATSSSTRVKPAGFEGWEVMARGLR